MIDPLVDLPLDTEYAHGDDGDEPSMMVSVSIVDTNGDNWSAAGHMTNDLGEERLAATIVRAALGAAALRSTGTWMSLQQHLTNYGHDQRP